MVILVDTNVLLRMVKPDDRDHALTKSAINQLQNDGHELVIVPQCLYEYYVVVTRPIEQNGMGLEPYAAASAIDRLLTLFRCYRDETGVLEVWKDLIAEYEVRGKNAHDTRLVATMKQHDIKHLLTFNIADFRRYASVIDVLDPRKLPTI